MYSVTGNVIIGHEGGGQLVSSQILLFSHLEGKTRWSGETECCFPWLCFGLKWRYATHIWHILDFFNLLYLPFFCGDRSIITFHVLNQNQGPYYGCKILHSGAAFFSYVTLLPGCHVFLFCGHSSAPVSQLHCGLWLMSALFFSVWCMTLDISSVAVLENGDFTRKSRLWTCWGVWSMQFFGDFHTFVPEAPFPAAEKRVISLCFLYILLFETPPLLFLFYQQVIYN